MSRLVDRFNDAVCHRAFSGPEALGYELMVARGVLDVVAPLIEPEVAGSSVLDVGCGGGLLAARLRRSGRRVVALDPSASQAKRARGIRAYAEALPFAAKAFDTVVSSCAIKHWPNMAAGVAECRRVLRADGPLVVVEIDRSSTPAEVARFAAMTRVPPGLRWAYVRFAMETVVAVAPTAGELSDVLGAPVRKVDGLPYNVVIARR
jgi:ubiquinone/menaquinone biosynthesis C-methylase UbiE